MMFEPGPPLRLIDYVLLDGPNSQRDLIGETPTGAPIGFESLWDTNIVNVTNIGVMPRGVQSQLFIGMGFITGDWQPYMIGTPPIQDITLFRGFLLRDVRITNTVVMCPFTPTLRITQTVSWQANDPLVHYFAGDLVDPQDSVSTAQWPEMPNIGSLNSRYQPWGGQPTRITTNAFDFSLKDPWVRSSDDWDFPTGQNLAFEWLGRVHRGTPWQTIYLKSEAASLADWQLWSGVTDAVQASRTHPTNDWAIASLWARWLNTNELTSLFSINSNPEAWSARLDGLTALTNSSLGQYDPVLINSNSPQAMFLAGAIYSARSNARGGYFRDVGDVLAVPELSITSPWLNHDFVPPFGTINDEAYEKVATQLLPMLRADSIGSARVQDGQSISTFTGYDGHCYRIEVSSNTIDWAAVQTELSR